MRNLLRKPLPWMVLAECAIVGALVVLAWHMVTNVPAPMVPLPPGASPRADSGAANGPLLTGGTAQREPARAPLPGLNMGANFWRLRLADLNRAQAAFEALEWRLVRSAMGAAQRYLESVVIPTVVRAEHRRG